MLDWILVIFIIVLGISLIVAEIIFVPGTTVVGVLGVGCVAFGVYEGFVLFGTNSGIWILIFSLIAGGIATVVSFRSGVWNKFALKGVNESKVNEEHQINLEVGQKGTAVSALRPFGKAEFADREFEVQTIGDYVDAGTALTIISIKGRKIFVEPLK